MHLWIVDFLIITVETVLSVASGERGEVFVCEGGLLDAIVDRENKVIFA